MFKIPLRGLLLGSISVSALFALVFFVTDLLVYYPKQFSHEWQYGYKEAVGYLSQVEDEYDMIAFSQVLGRPYIYMLFYTQYPPQEFRDKADISRDIFGFVTIKSIGKYYSGKELLPATEGKRVLYFDKEKDMPPGAKIQKKFYRLDGKVALVAFTL